MGVSFLIYQRLVRSLMVFHKEHRPGDVGDSLGVHVRSQRYHR
jgi:hypothetical protein